MRLEGIEELITKYHVRATTIVKALDFTTKKNAEEIRENAKKRAPVLTGTLRGSLATEQKLPMVWGVGSYHPNVPYAKIRNYINKKNPGTVGYLTNSLFEQRDKYQRDIKEAIKELKKL
jgi:hypothetical protein